MVTQTRSGANLVKNLPNYMKCLNNEKHEELGWQSPFTYWSSPELKIDFNRFKKLRPKIRKRALDFNERVGKRTVEYFRKRIECSVY